MAPGRVVLGVVGAKPKGFGGVTLTEAAPPRERHSDLEAA
jgi:hypothetical protein